MSTDVPRQSDPNYSKPGGRARPWLLLSLVRAHPWQFNYSASYSGPEQSVALYQGGRVLDRSRHKRDK